MPRRLLILFTTLWLTAAWPAVADHARAATTGPTPSAERAEPAPWERAVVWVWTQQRHFYHRFNDALRALRDRRGSGWLLIAVGLLYGIFHAAGPGHGKVVLTTYLLTQRQRLTRGVTMAVAAALTQGITAIVLVYGLIGLAGLLPRETQTAVAWTERLSFLLVTVVGGMLLVRGARALLAPLRAARGHAVHSHEHHHDPRHAHCGCRHTPSGEQIEQAADGRTALGVVLAIGLRPCSGAVLMLIFAHAMQLHWAGAAAVLAMSAGTAITVTALAALAVGARHWATKLTGRRLPGWGAAGALLTGLAGVLVAATGLSLLLLSFAPPPPLQLLTVPAGLP